ncbi:unnamed protein product [Paramecium primaurelia]|uniref:Uncharacterized protein n=1 Tax=Paramecium primaurelia TaxID=5886 RepID=A0A8S1NK19_PARPR|nr:unnamed protein product [Paramecium primaurelia]
MLHREGISPLNFKYKMVYSKIKKIQYCFQDSQNNKVTTNELETKLREDSERMKKNEKFIMVMNQDVIEGYDTIED